MKKILLLVSIVLSLCAAAYFLCHDTVPVEKEAFENPMEENELIAKREHEMLADPATGEIPAGISFRNLEFLQALTHDNAAFRKTRGATWSSRGPWNVGGRTRAIAVDVSNEQHILAGAVSGGIWQSMDGGLSWQRVSDINGHPGVVSITQDKRPGKTNNWYALSGELYGTSASGGGAFYLGDGAFKSVDNGATWQPIASTASGSPNNFTSSFQGGWRIVHASVDTVATCIYMATYGSIYRSIDTGNTWRIVLGINNNNSYFTDVQVTSTGIVYATLSSAGNVTRGFFRSADGVNFTDITPSFLKSYDRTVIGINPNNENEVYFLSELPSDTSGGVTTANYEGQKEYVSLVKYKYISGDGSGAGGQWTNLSGNLPVNSTNPFDRFNCQGGYDLFVRVQPGSNTVVIGGTNLYRSTDGFTSPGNIQQIGGYGIGTTVPFFTVYANHHPDQHDFIFLDSDPKKAYSISDGGVKFSADVNAPSVVWQDRSEGYITSQLYSIAIDEQHAYDPWLIGGFQDNGNQVSNTNDPQHHWLLPVNGDGAYSYIDPDKSFFVTSIQQGRMVKVHLHKQGYLMARRRIDPAGFTKADYAFINPFVVDPNDANILYMPIGKKIARLNNLKSISVNNDYSQLKTGWTIFSDTIKTPKLVSRSSEEAEITALAISKNQPNILYIGTSNKEMYRLENANTGDPRMIKLDTISKRLPTEGYVSGIAIDPDSASNVLVCISNYGCMSLFFSRDYGNTFYYVGGNLEFGSQNPTGGDPSIRCVNILVNSNGKRTYFAGTSIGLFSTDSLVLSSGSNLSLNKTKWFQEGADKIGAAVVTSIKVRRADGYVAVGTHGNGVFESYYLGNTPPVSHHYGNANIYPNPVSDNLYVELDATGAASYHAEVYDLSGRRLSTFSNGIRDGDVFRQVINVSRYSPGHYFLSYHTDNHIKQAVMFTVVH